MTFILNGITPVENKGILDAIQTQLSNASGMGHCQNQELKASKWSKEHAIKQKRQNQ
jgi:hypothetical protein